MKIDPRHRTWLLGAVISSGLALLLTLAAPAHGTVSLALGGVGAALVLAAALLGLRRRLGWLALGSAASWQRAHLWLGALCLIFSLLHSRLRLGGGLSTALTLLLCASVLSGVLGVLLQRVLIQEINALSADTIFDLPRATLSARRRAYELVWAACGAPPDAPDEAQALQALLGAAPRAPESPRAPGSLAGQRELARFYRELILPFLRSGPGGARLATAADATLAFDALEAQLAEPLRATLGELHQSCRRLRGARRQHRLHRWLHGWVLLHVPLSMALLVLLLTHAVMALRY